MKADEKRGRGIAKERSNGLCEVHISGVCTGVGQTVHHRKNRSQGGTWAPSNLLHLCGDGTRGCHGWITLNPLKSRDKGWSVRRCAEPSEERLLTWQGWVLFADDGGIEFLSNEKEVGSHV